VKLVDHFQYGLNSPICLTWELTYACNLACVHCLSSSGRRDPRELSTAEAKSVIDELQRMQVFYVNIGGGEPTVRSDFWELLDYAVTHDVGVKFSTNGIKLDEARAAQLAATDYVDVQISLDGATAEVNDHVRGPGSYATAIRALENLAAAGFGRPKISVVMTRQNVDQLDEFSAIADRFGAQLRITRLRPSGRGADVWDELHPTAAQQRQLYDWLVAHGENVLTGLRRGAAGAEPVRGRAGGLPDRPGGRRLRLPVRDPRELPGGQRALAGRVPGGVARLGAVRRAPAAADRRCVPQLRLLRLLPGRLHGGQVLHRPPARRAGPGVRPRLRRAGPRRPGRRHGDPEVGRRPLPVGPPQLPGTRTRLDRDAPGPGVRREPSRRPARPGSRKLTDGLRARSAAR
jgi:MoaA/NifB/PqqE/SkfB family radical SAM enzyme